MTKLMISHYLNILMYFKICISSSSYFQLSTFTLQTPGGWTIYTSLRKWQRKAKPGSLHVSMPVVYDANLNKDDPPRSVKSRFLSTPTNHSSTTPASKEAALHLIIFPESSPSNWYKVSCCAILVS